MKRLMHLFLLLAVGSFALGCQGTEPLPEGTAEDEAAIEDDMGMQEAELAGDPEGGEGGDPGAEGDGGAPGDDAPGDDAP